MFPFQEKQPKKLNYVVKAVNKASRGGRNSRRKWLATGIIISNIAFLAGFMAYFTRFSGQYDVATNLINQSVPGFLQNLDNIALPIAKQGLGFVSSENFPTVASPNSNLDPEQQEIADKITTASSIQALKTLNYPKWDLVGSGNLTSLKSTDLVWRNKDTFNLVAWTLNKGVLVNIKNLPTILSADYSVAVINDFNGDTQSDILWRKTAANGEDRFLLWTIENGSVKNQQWIETDISDIGDWILVGAQDFDANNTPDLVFTYKGLKSEIRGANLVQYLSYKNQEVVLKEGTSQSWLPWQTTLDGDNRPMLNLIAVRDVNKDGYPDLIWRKNRFYTNTLEQGDLLVWIMKDRDYLTSMSLPNKDGLLWNPIFLDLLNNGETDIIWRNIDDVPGACKSATSIWIMEKVFRLNTKINQKIEGC